MTYSTFYYRLMEKDQNLAKKISWRCFIIHLKSLFHGTIHYDKLIQEDKIIAELKKERRAILTQMYKIVE